MKKADLLSTLFVGIDVSSRENVLCAIDYEAEKHLTFSVSNNQPGAVVMAERLQKFLSGNKDMDRLVVALESTSFYGIHIANYLSSCERAGTTMDINQLESLKVINAPLPGTLWEYSSINFRNRLPLQVTVKDSQFDSSALPKNGLEFPRPAFLAAIFIQRSTDMGFPGINSAAFLKEPSFELSVIQPVVTRQRSPS